MQKCTKVILLFVFVLLGNKNLYGGDFEKVRLNTSYITSANITRYRDHIHVSGQINKSLGCDLARTKIVVNFVDDAGRALITKEDKVVPIRTHLVKGRKGHFLICIPFDEKIKSCQIDVKWG